MKKIVFNYIISILIIVSLIQVKTNQVQQTTKTKMNVLAILVEDSINSYGYINESTFALLKKNQIEFHSNSKIKKSEKYEFSLSKDILSFWQNQKVEFVQTYEFICQVDFDKPNQARDKALQEFHHC